VTKTRKPNNPTNYQDLVGRIKSVGDIDLKVTALFVGRSGTGKTTLASTFPKPLLHIDVRDEGYDSIADLGDEVKTITVTEWEEIEQLYWYLRSGEHPFKSVAIDPVSQLQDLGLSHVLKMSGKGSGDFISRGVYGDVSKMMKTWLLNYRDLPLNVAFTAQDRVSVEDEDDEDEQLSPEVGPSVMPSVAKALNGMVKVIGYTFIKEVAKKQEGKISKEPEFWLRVGPHAIYVTKIRNPRDTKPPEAIPNPTYDKIVSVMKGDYVEEKPKTKKKGKVKDSGKEKGK